MAEPTIDLSIYGASPIPEDLKLPSAQALEQYKPPEQVAVAPAATRGLYTSYAQGQADLSAALNKPEASGLASMAAGVKNWSVVHAYEALTQPTFAPEEGFNPAEMAKQVKFQLTNEQEEFLFKARSSQEFQYKLDKLETQRVDQAAMGDHALLSFGTMMLDPGYIAVDIASMGAARLARVAGAGAVAQRVVAAGTATTGAVALGEVENSVLPMSQSDIFLNAMLNGALTGALYRGGRLAPVDEAFPGQELNSIAADMRRAEAGPELGPVDSVPSPGNRTTGAAAPGDNLTRPRVEPTGEGTTPVTYGRGEAAGSDYRDSTVADQGSVTSVRSVQDIADVAESVRSGHTKVDPDAKAVYLPGEDKVFLIHDNIKPGDDVRGILLHEVGVHMNGERVLGTKGFGSLLDSLEDMALAGNSRAKQAFADVPKNTPLHLVREEALGYYIERNHALTKDSIVSRMVASVREFLRRHGILKLGVSESDIIALVRKAAKSKTPGSFDTAFPYVWHGSAVRGIDRLDSAFIGTGEGRQAFGSGHYLTSEKGTALDYRNKESLRRGVNPEDGGLYRVKINAPQEAFLNLDSALQSPQVQSALDALGLKGTGKQAYDELAKRLGSDKAASAALVEQGVAGNRYATGRTRGKDTQNSNYVVFSDSSVDMVARYSMPLPQSAQQAQKTVAQAVGEKVSWSLHKTLAGFGERAREVADLLVDDPLRMGGDSVVSQHRAIRADLQRLQFVYEDLLAASMAQRGYGLFKRIVNPRQALREQQALEREVALEMLRRDRLSREGLPVDKAGIPAEVTAMADALDNVAKVSASELKRAGVAGAEDLVEQSGYFSRKWDYSRISAIEQRLVAAGATEAAAKQTVQDAISIGVARANGYDAQLSRDIGTAIYDRARRKGYFEDSAIRTHAGNETVAEVSDVLDKAGVTGSRKQQVMEILTGKNDDAGKMNSLKKRVDIAMDEAITMPDGSSVTVGDMIDTNLATLTDRYLDNVASQAAFARKGLVKPSDIADLRKSFLESIPREADRAAASKLYDNVIDYLKGNPVGEELPRFMRMAQGVTRMVGLARAGLFQFTEYATLMAHYGGTATMGQVFKEMPYFREMFGTPKEAEHLRNILAGNASQDMRLRPFIQRMEDNFEIPVSDAMQLSMQQAQQLVPYMNALKFIQAHQSRVAANLIVDTFVRGAQGDAKAAQALSKYGLEPRIMVNIASDIRAHGADTAKWSAGTFDAVRGPLTKMMDDAVLRNRTGEIPAFAQFTSTGKFVFTFRSFVLGAHNKVLAGSLHRDGFSGLGLLMLYQAPITYAITAANNRGTQNKQLNDKQILAETFSQMGSMGLFSEAIGVAFGTKQQFGSPGTIAFDRAYKLGSAIASGNPGQAGAAALNSVPLLSIILPVKAIGENLKDNKKE